MNFELQSRLKTLYFRHFPRSVQVVQDTIWGRILSAQAQQMKPNAVSERLLVLAAGFQTDYEVGILYADKFMERGEDKILSSARNVYQESLDAMDDEPDWSAELYLAQAEEVRQVLLPLLLQVQSSISIILHNASHIRLTNAVR